MSHVIEWYDSSDPTDRRKNLSLWLSSPEGQRGTLYECEREHPSDVWPVARKVGSGYSITSAEKFAKRMGLVRADA